MGMLTTAVRVRVGNLDSADNVVVRELRRRSQMCQKQTQQECR